MGYDEEVPRVPETSGEPSAGSTADRRLGGRLGLAAAAAFLVAVPFTLLLFLVESSWAPLEDLDRSAARRLHQTALEHGWLVDLLNVVSIVFDPWVFRVTCLLVALWLWRRGAPRLAAWAAVTTVVAGALGGLLKLLVHRVRPVLDDPVAHANGYSFPSGHALGSLVGTGVLILVFLPVLGRTGRWAAYGGGALVVLMTGFSRIGLGVHFVSDVLAGWVVGLACLAATSAAFEVWRREEGRPASTPGQGVEPEAAGVIDDGNSPDRADGAPVTRPAGK